VNSEYSQESNRRERSSKDLRRRWLQGAARGL